MSKILESKDCEDRRKKLESNVQDKRAIIIEESDFFILIPRTNKLSLTAIFGRGRLLS